jgi:hypothetical protein
MAGTDVTCTVESQETIDIFKANQGNPVRILRPVDCSQPYDTAFSFSNPTDDDRNNRHLRLQRASGAFAGGEIIKRGDMIVMTGSAPPTPDSIVYALVNGGTVCEWRHVPAESKCITRNAGGTVDIIASNISDLSFNYMLDDGTEETPLRYQQDKGSSGYHNGSDIIHIPAFGWGQDPTAHVYCEKYGTGDSNSGKA